VDRPPVGGQILGRVVDELPDVGSVGVHHIEVEEKVAARALEHYLASVRREGGERVVRLASGQLLLAGSFCGRTTKTGQ
jgi:hypothetical protein